MSHPANACLKINDEGLKIIKEDEGCALHAYQDEAGVWTCGWGSTHGVAPDTCWTQEQADAQLIEDLEATERFVLKDVLVPLNSNQFSALVSFSYNEGEGHLDKSTLLRYINASEFEKAADEFPRWMLIRGRKSAGLLRRREQEKQLFETPLDVSPNSAV